MTADSYLQASKICKMVFDGQIIEDTDELDKLWPKDRDDFLDEVCSDIIEFWGEKTRNKGQTEEEKYFHRCIMAAHHILAAKLDPIASSYLYKKILDDLNIKTEEDLKSAIAAHI